MKNAKAKRKSQPARPGSEQAAAAPAHGVSARAVDVMLDALESAAKYGRFGWGGAVYLERLTMAVKLHKQGEPFREPTTPDYW